MNFRIIGDTIELDGLPVATILASVWPTRRDYLAYMLEAYESDRAGKLAEELAEANERITYRDNEIAGLREEVECLQVNIAELEDAQ